MSTFAGCGGRFGGLFSEEPTQLDSDELEAIATDDYPNVPETLPIRIRESHLDSSEGRARELLDGVPDPLGPAEIPNEAIRRNLQDVRDRATYFLEEAATIESRYGTLIKLRRARRYAANVAAAWRTIEDGDGSIDIEAEAEEIDQALASFHEGWEYVGEDSSAALLVHEALESMAGSADRALQNGMEDAETGLESAPAVGEAVEWIETARATVEDASHIYEQHENSLETPRSVRNQFETAGSSLADEVEERLDPLPTLKPGDAAKLVDRDVSGEPSKHLLEEFVREIYWGSGELREGNSDGPAAAVRTAHRTLAYVEALEPIQKRIDEGERFEVESVEDVRSWREEATEAVSALTEEENENALLNRAMASQLVDGFSTIDRELTYESDPAYASSVSRYAVDYLQIAAVADAVPAASRAVADALRNVAVGS